MKKKMKGSALPAKKAHATYSASGSERWLACAGSVNLSEKAPPARESHYAEEGTEAHECLEFLLRHRKNLKAAVIVAGQNYNEEIITNALKAVEYVGARLKAMPSAELLVEERADLPVSEPDQFGTTDIGIVDHFGTLEVTDYKYGAGIPVSPEENSQLLYYALGIAHKYDYNFSKVILTIVQPRADIDGKFIRSWETSVETLLEWREKFEAGIQAAKDPDAKLSSGEHCRFCPAKVICPEIGKKALRDAMIDFAPETGVLKLPEVKEIAIPHLGRLLKACDSIEIWIGAVRTHAFHALERGEKVKGFKLVPKRSTRKWVAPEKVKAEARKRFGDGAFTKPELLSPAQLEKACKAKEFVAARASSVSTGLTLVPESDPRQAVSPASDDFLDGKDGGNALTKLT